MHSVCILSSLILLSSVVHTFAFQIPFPQFNVRRRCNLQAALNDQDATDMKGISGMKGYYRRPSRAIEKGGGFYVPGLEGERIRIITSGALVLMYIANRAGQTTASLSQVISELTGLSVAILLFAQGAVDAFVGQSASIDPAAASAIAPTYLSVIQNNISPADSSSSSPSSVAETLARSLVQTSEDINYVALLCVDEAAGTKVLLELGPVQGAPLSQEAASAISSKCSSMPGSERLAIMSYQDFLQRAGVKPCFPLGTQSIAFSCRTTIGTSDASAQKKVIWLVGSSTDTAAKADGWGSWIEALVSAPISL